MPIQPNSRAQQIQFFETILPLWTANAVAIGLTAPEVTAFTTKVASARTTLTTAETARNASRNATINYYTSTDTMSEEGGELIKRITSYAQLRNNPNIYALAGLPAPATPQPKPAPGTPFEFRAFLDQNGAVRLVWKCVNPTGSQGTIYNVSRRLGTDPNAPFTFVGAIGEKEFTDTTLPIGAGNGVVTYQVVAVRSTKAGAPALFTVNFGTAAGGEAVIASISEQYGMKKAA